MLSNWGAVLHQKHLGSTRLVSTPMKPLPCPVKQGPALLGLTKHIHENTGVHHGRQFKLWVSHTLHRQTGLNKGLHLRSLGTG